MAGGTPHGSAHDLGTWLDARIPFVAGSVWVYLGVFPLAFLPLFVVREKRLFRRTIVAYAAALVVALIAFVVYPVSSLGLRAPLASLDTTRISDWGVKTLYRVDPPYNLFPSLHLTIALLASGAAWKASRKYGSLALVATVPIGVSILTLKQHFVWDGVAAVVLAGAVYAAVLHRYSELAN